MKSYYEIYNTVANSILNTAEEWAEINNDTIKEAKESIGMIETLKSQLASTHDVRTLQNIIENKKIILQNMIKVHQNEERINKIQREKLQEIELQKPLDFNSKIINFYLRMISANDNELKIVQKFIDMICGVLNEEQKKALEESINGVKITIEGMRKNNQEVVKPSSDTIEAIQEVETLKNDPNKRIYESFEEAVTDVFSEKNK